MKIVVLDDYQGIAGEFADWDSLGAEIHTITRHVSDLRELHDLLYDAPSSSPCANEPHSPGIF